MPEIHKILIPTDGSENTRAAIAQGLDFARMLKAEVTALSVVDQSSFANASQGLGAPDMYDHLGGVAEAAVELVFQEGERRGVKVRRVMERGFPADVIVKASMDHDLIVMGTLGRTGLSHLLLGSVAEKVVRLAYCPVLVVRDSRRH